MQILLSPGKVFLCNLLFADPGRPQYSITMAAGLDIASRSLGDILVILPVHSRALGHLRGFTGGRYRSFTGFRSCFGERF